MADPQLDIDHVMYVTHDLDACSSRILGDLGLASIVGGRHPGHGTGNRIVPLGRDYVELMSVIDREEAMQSSLGRWVLSAIERGDGPALACIRTDDLSPVCDRLGLEAVPMQRTRPDGATLNWKIAGLDHALASPYLPFFIQWDIDPEMHPGRATALHRVRPAGISWLEVAGEPAVMREWLGDDSLPISVVAGDPSVRAVGIASDTGELVLGAR